MLTHYSVPLEDYRFVYDVLGLARIADLPGFADATPDLIEQVIVEAGRYVTDILFPLNRQSDEIGARFVDGAVITPPGFKEAYDRFCEGGWPALTGPTAYGGQDLPAFVEYILTEMMAATCMSFAQYTGLTHGAAMAIAAHADESLKQLYLPKMISGEWSGTMCLTEAHAGTDLGLMRTRAVPVSDGAYAITGTKIFISAGEHDLSGNIVHLVLAKLPDAPLGVQGISLFLVPKFLPDADGEPGERNGVACGSIERKMGMKGAVACVMNFDGALGWIVGAPHKGLRAMFTMMNTERLLLSAQGQGAAETAYQSAAAYARDRLQGRAAGGAKAPLEAADPIIVHPDVRRMLLTMKAYAEGGRALALWVMSHVDIAARHADPAERARADALVALMTPVVKVWLSDNGSEAANIGVQVLGGHGYIREWGMEQLVRDIRILQLYEGANGIQALDLVARKLPMEGGRMIRHLTEPVDSLLDAFTTDTEYGEFIIPLRESRDRLDLATQWMRDQSLDDADALGAGSMDYLKITGFLAQAYVWAMMAIAAKRDYAKNPEFFGSKLATARFFFAKMLPFADAHLATLKAGAAPLMTLAAEEF
ncbi:acyl-CoA dehydrogenase C-terminal domain-containing protein [Sphingobium sp. CR2-8]|uniref:acyl-CoA dehydrogenase C-terminal domain-containing protein n=1 Tax=Sphingobium sp. CR2-8 TaxID=1306534 RepID=UPI002DB747FF|nr:acyl-CoA dehydrogenase C-terminal domain-containing protein [Sphingobium sp. CR2-8]MEC3909227.1 acyl-CoA dehydrogenase C-terminal domain-containing protein [Sphingobium sp. CR2-8]